MSFASSVPAPAMQVEAAAVSISAESVSVVNVEKATKPAEMSVKSSVISSAARDVKKASWLFMLIITVLSCYHTVRLKYFDVRDYFGYQGTIGPVEVLTDDQGKVDAGPPITSIRPGQQFGWIVSLCLNEGASIKYRLEFYRLAQPGFPEMLVSSKDGDITPASRRCGTRLNVWTVPADALPGQYEVRRSVTVRDFMPIHQTYSPVSIAVSSNAPMPVPAPAPVAPAPAPVARSVYKIDL